MNQLMTRRLSPLTEVYRSMVGDACRRYGLPADAGNGHRALADWGYLGEPVSGAVLEPSAVLDFARPLLGDQAAAQLEATIGQPAPVEAADRGYQDQQAQHDYRLDVFGDASAPDGWAWRLNGPHVGLHFAVGADGVGICATPLFLGGSASSEADWIALALTDSLTVEQRRTALADPLPPAEIRTRHDRRAFLPGVPDGIAYPALNERQRARLDELVLHHLGALRPLADLTRSDLNSALDAENLTFAYAGEPGCTWYYCLKSPRLVIEYLNRSGHVHCVLRDAHGDWAGLDQKWPAT